MTWATLAGLPRVSLRPDGLRKIVFDLYRGFLAGLGPPVLTLFFVRIDGCRSGLLVTFCRFTAFIRDFVDIVRHSVTTRSIRGGSGFRLGHFP
jgi:hypothetical protein